LRVQHNQVMKSLCRVHHLGQVLWNCHVKARCKYHVKWPNVLWHIDSHHKLIQWGIVIHAFIDG
ncbi:hypothetical protein EDD15DRAFT_2144767, partial [Pisolithus albus]